jgi:hypothetical protein
MEARRTTDMRLAMPLLLVSCLGAGVAAAQSPAASPSPAAAPAPAAPAAAPPAWAAEVERYVADVQRMIKGKEDVPAKEVFKNVTMLGDVPASRLLRTMQGWTRALGVSCTKCHVPDKWESDEKDGKEVTRDMMKMTRAINDDYLKKIKALEEDKPSVNCFTCHRGQAHPGAELRPANAPAR